VARTGQDDVLVEKFARGGGSFVSVVGGLVVVGALAGWAADVHQVPLVVPAVAVLVGVLLWTSTLRPRMLVEGRELVLRNMLTTVRLPLATVEEIVVQQVVAVRAGGRRFRCAGAGRTLRTVVKGAGMPRRLGGTEVERGMDYGDYIETRVRQLVNDDRDRRGISSAYDPEVEQLSSHIRRQWAWPEVAAVAIAVLLVVLAVLVD
jgi:hypothetical protein